MVSAGGRALAQPAGDPAHPAAAHAADPLAQDEPGHQPGPEAEAGPEHDLHPAQPIAIDARHVLLREDSECG